MLFKTNLSPRMSSTAFFTWASFAPSFAF